VANKVVARAIASLQKKTVLWQARWKETCAAKQTERARRDQLTAFVERYLMLRDELARDTAEWNRDDRRRYSLLQVTQRQRK
jgi:hypothetical protein